MLSCLWRDKMNKPRVKSWLLTNLHQQFICYECGACSGRYKCKNARNKKHIQHRPQNVARKRCFLLPQVFDHPNLHFVEDCHVHTWTFRSKQYPLRGLDIQNVSEHIRIIAIVGISIKLHAIGIPHVSHSRDSCDILYTMKLTLKKNTNVYLKVKNILYMPACDSCYYITSFEKSTIYIYIQGLHINIWHHSYDFKPAHPTPKKTPTEAAEEPSEPEIGV